MALPDKEWYSQQELADNWGVKLAQVQRHVSSLSAAGVINTTRNPKDRRELLIHKSGIDLIRRAVLGDAGEAGA